VGDDAADVPQLCWKVRNLNCSDARSRIAHIGVENDGIPTTTPDARAMRLRLLPIALSAALLAACGGDHAPADAQTAPPASEQGSTAGESDTAVPPATTPPPSLPEADKGSDVPPASSPDGSDAQASFSGYGDVRFGTAAADMERAWGGALREVGKSDNDTCYYMTPTWVAAPADFSFMIGDGKFVRFGTESAKFAAPGGGRVGMSQAEIEKLYPGRVELQPHKYSDGKYLRIKDAGGGNGVLIFETNENGMVEEFRVGVPPEVDYVEGCS
jgi:hypothetical protein